MTKWAEYSADKKGENMTIQLAVQKSYGIQIYGENGVILGSIAADRDAGDMLLGYTASSVTVKKTNYINTYNEHGVLMFSNPA